MPPPPVWDVYAAELSTEGHGYPMWFPEPLEDGTPPEKGDVGYICEGRFRRMFNITKPPSEHSKYSYEVLEYDEELKYTLADAIQTKVICSHSVTTREVQANVGADGTPAGVPAGGNVNYKYTCTRERGAMLLLKENAHEDRLAHNNIFPTYMKKHHSDWVKQMRTRNFDTRKLDIILVYGTVKTKEWTVAAFQNNERGQSVDISGTFLSAAQVGFTLATDSQAAASVRYRSGPSGPTAPERCIPSPTPSLSLSSTANQLTVIGGSTPPLTHTRSRSVESSAPCNQCIFLPHYKIKSRFFFRKIEAAAGPHRLPDPDQDDEMAPAVVVTDGDGESGDDADHEAADVSGPVDIVLDYILENSEAEVAVACDGDVSSLFVGTSDRPDDFRQWLDINTPRIVVEDGLGTLSLKEAVARERRAVLHKMTRRANPQMQGPQNQDEGGDNTMSHPGSHRASGARSLIGEGQCLLGKDMATDESFGWPHMMLSEDDLEAGTISSIALAPGGEFVATGSDDSAVRVWSVKTGQLFRKWQAHEDSVWTVAFSPSGTQVASGSADASIILWDLHSATGAGEVGRLKGHDLDVWQVAYSPDGSMLASGAGDNTVMVWDPQGQALLHTLRGHTTQIIHLAFTADNTRIVSCAEARGIVWDAVSGMPIAALEDHTGSIWSMALSHAGDRIITGSEDHTARIWDTATGQELVRIHEHMGPIWAVAFSPDDEEVVTGSYDSTLATNDSWSGERRQVFSENPGPIDALAYSSNGKFIASGAADGNVKLWSRRDGSMLAEFSGHEDKCKSATFINGNKDLLTSSDDRSLRVWSVQDVLRLV